MTIELTKQLNGTLFEQVVEMLNTSKEDLVNNVCINCKERGIHTYDTYNDYKISPEYLRKLQSYEYLLLKDGDKIVGILSYVKAYNKEKDVSRFELFINALFIRKEYRRKGWGSNLLKAFEDIWQSRRVVVVVCSKNEEIKKFMSANLYKIIKVTREYSDKCFGADLYEKYTNEYLYNI